MIATSAIASPLVKGAVQPPPLLERLRKTALDRGTARPTVDQMVGWARAFILFHNKRHPAEMGLAEVGHFLEHVVKTEPDPLPALAQARRALGTLYEDVLGVRLGELPQPRPPRASHPPAAGVCPCVCVKLPGRHATHPADRRSVGACVCKTARAPCKSSVPRRNR